MPNLPLSSTSMPLQKDRARVYLSISGQLSELKEANKAEYELQLFIVFGCAEQSVTALTVGGREHYYGFAIEPALVPRISAKE